ncbi:MAG: COQ9 family protein [Acetobacteraceae bacterium]|nr:COQ9 family protein [Acetobacteraceae bacterium]
MIERSPERDAALDAMLPLVPEQGWTVAALREAAGEDADLLFPGGAVEMAEAWADLSDRRMEAGAAELGLDALRLPARVRAVIALRLAQSRPHKTAVRRALAVLARPGAKAAAARATARTVDAIWHTAGDQSADFSWYTKRAILAGVYGSTLLRWLNDASEDDGPTLAFLDRRLGDVARIGKARRRVASLAQRLRPRAAM